MASRTCSLTRKLGTTVIVLTTASLISGCMRDEEENIAEMTPAHGAQGVTANLGGNEAVDGAPNSEGIVAVPTQNYIVQRGDTLSALSTKFQIPVSAIKEANEMTTDIIFYGKTIKIPVADSPSNLASGTTSPYTDIAAKPTPDPKPEPVEMKKTVKAAELPVPPAPPTITSPDAPVATNNEDRRSLGAAFGGTGDGKTGAPEPRMPSTGGVSPFYEQGSTGSATPVPAVSGQPKPSADDSGIPPPRE